MRVLTEGDIDDLLADVKPLPTDWPSKLKPKPKQGSAHRQRQLRIKSAGGLDFELIIRASEHNPLDFSVILAYIEVTTGQHYNLIRHNGKHPSYHTNKIEHRQGLAESRFKDRFHIHRATERYQLAGYAIDGFAQPTTAYDSLDKAIEWMTRSYGFQVPEPDAPLYTQREGE